MGTDSDGDRELRIALAMRGGASMAVWIGGAVAEINRMREAVHAQTAEPVDETASAHASARTTSTADATIPATAPGFPGNSGEPAEHAVGPDTNGDRDVRAVAREVAEAPDDPPHPWARLARLAGYDAVSIDVLAGASAGGLNGTLLSATLVYGMPFDRMRQLWVRLADIESMARPTPRLGQPAPPSLLDGDGYLRSELARAMREHADESGVFSAGRLDLLLTATLLDPVVDWQHDDRGERLRLERRDARLRFQHHGDPDGELSDFGSGAEFSRTTERLAQAARTTSAYPFAFEPARVHSSPHDPPAGEPDLFGKFTETTDRPDTPFRVVDGGVLDNIPVSGAIRAIARAPADRPTQRWLLYLNPDPSVSAEPRSSGLAVPVASAALRARLTQESLSSDLDTLWAHNDQVGRREAHREELLAAVWSAPAPEQHAELARQATSVQARNTLVRAELDAQAAYRLLTDPAATADEYPLTPSVADPLGGWSGAAVTGLKQRLQTRLERLATPETLHDVVGLRSAVREALGWAWDLEAKLGKSETVAGSKNVLYRLWTFAEVLAGCADRYWSNSAYWEPIVEPAETDAWIRRVARRRQRLQHQLPAPVRPLLGEALRAVSDGVDFSAKLAEFAREIESIVDSLGGDAVEEDALSVDAVNEGFAVLDQVLRDLAVMAPRQRHIDTAAHLQYALLERANDAPEVLRQLVTVTVGLDIGRSPGTAINFLRIASSEQTPLPFHALRRGTSTIHTEDKVRGTDLGNFGAFLSARWRGNDWMWGRMDAVAGVVRLLTDPQRWVQRYPGADDLVEDLQEIVTHPTRAEFGELSTERHDEWYGFFLELWTRYAEQVRAELAGLFDHPHAVHELPTTRRLLRERMQWVVAAGEIPYVDALGNRSTGDDEPVERRFAGPAHIADQIERYDVGRQRHTDLEPKHRLSVATRLGLLAYAAARPKGSGVWHWFARAAMTLLKPFALLAVFVLATPTRAAGIAFLGTSAVTFTALPTPSPSGAAAVPWAQAGVVAAGPVLAALLTVFTACWFGVRLTSSFGAGWARWVPGLALGGGLILAELAVLAGGLRNTPLGLAVVVAVSTWLCTLAYRTGARIAATALGFVVFLGSLALLAGPLGSAGLDAPLGVGWIALSLLLVAYTQSLLISLVDVLPPRRG